MLILQSSSLRPVLGRPSSRIISVLVPLVPHVPAEAPEPKPELRDTIHTADFSFPFPMPSTPWSESNAGPSTATAQPVTSSGDTSARSFSSALEIICSTWDFLRRFEISLLCSGSRASWIRWALDSICIPIVNTLRRNKRCQESKTKTRSCENRSLWRLRFAFPFATTAREWQTTLTRTAVTLDNFAHSQLVGRPRFHRCRVLTIQRL